MQHVQQQMLVMLDTELIKEERDAILQPESAPEIILNEQIAHICLVLRQSGMRMMLLEVICIR